MPYFLLVQNNNLLISCQENGGDIIHYVFTYLLIYSAPLSPRRLSLSTVRYFPNLIIATWTPPIPKNGIITAYSVYCNTSVNSPIIGAKTNATTLVVTINTGSDMFTLYSCYVTANTSIGEGTPSQMTTIESRESHIKFITAVTAFFHIAIHFGDIYNTECNSIEGWSSTHISKKVSTCINYMLQEFIWFLSLQYLQLH